MGDYFLKNIYRPLRAKGSGYDPLALRRRYARGAIAEIRSISRLNLCYLIQNLCLNIKICNFGLIEIR